MYVVLAFVSSMHAVERVVVVVLILHRGRSVTNVESLVMLAKIAALIPRGDSVGAAVVVVVMVVEIVSMTAVAVADMVVDQDVDPGRGLMIVVARDEVGVVEDPHQDQEVQEKEFDVILIAVVPVQDLCQNQEIIAHHPEIEEVHPSHDQDQDPRARTGRMTTEVTATTDEEENACLSVHSSNVALRSNPNIMPP